MDGFDTKTNIVVLAATNIADTLDAALTRPGRFDRKIEINTPTIQEREEIFKIYLRKIKYNPILQIDDLSKKLAGYTPGMVGADIEHLCNESALLAARENKVVVDIDHFLNSTDRIIAGLKRHLKITPEEKKIISVHESGHTITGWYLPNSSPVLKVSIIPRSKGSLGFT